MTELDRLRREIVRFMRGRYALDEVGNGKDELKFRRGGKTVLTLLMREDRFDFLLIFGKAERERFEALRETLSDDICTLYDAAKTYHDGKWVMFPVATCAAFEAIQPLIMLKKKPNRKPFPKENAFYSQCGMRCDLCVHYTGGTITDERRQTLKAQCTRVYQANLWGEDMMLCPGCQNKIYDDMFGEQCHQRVCAKAKGVAACVECKEYPCPEATVGYAALEPRSISSDEVTGVVLPYVADQYGN